MIYMYGVLAYVGMTVVTYSIGFLHRNWLVTSEEHRLSFRKPTFYRIGAGMFSLLFLAVGVFVVVDTYVSSIGFKIFFFLSCSSLAGLFAYIAGPQDVYVDIETRICHETTGWMLHPRKRSLALTENSCVSICADNTSYYVILMIGSGTKRYFIIARPASLSQAHLMAEPTAGRLQLPVKETTLKDLLQLG